MAYSICELNSSLVVGTGICTLAQSSIELLLYPLNEKPPVLWLPPLDDGYLFPYFLEVVLLLSLLLVFPPNDPLPLFLLPAWDAH